MSSGLFVSLQNFPVFVFFFYRLGQATGNARCCLYVAILFTLCYLLNFKYIALKAKV